MTTAPSELAGNLPIYGYRDNILAAVDNNQVTIITAETGAGKSTQVPQYLAGHGYKKIIVTQPRILAARNLSGRVREEVAQRTDHDGSAYVGYRTAHEHNDDPGNVILYCTDGLQLVRELTGNGSGDKQVLVLDEIHEWNENMEVLIAWARKRCREDPMFRVVLMSATIEADSLAQYFGNAAVINVPGRSYAVEKRSGSDVVSEITTLLETKTSNILVFLPGKAEIENVTAELKKKAAAYRVPILPLHSQLDMDVQQRVFAGYERGKIILATNVAQTSITIDDIDTVIDSGLERRSEVRSGVEGLFIAQVSQADCLQRAGRAGRTKEGLYILARLDDLPCDPLDKRPPYGVPEILRKHIDRLVLRLANIDINIEDLDFYHEPKPGIIKQAKYKLAMLGALTSRGEVTPIGQKMERFPVESGYARMLVEAQQYAPEIQAKLAAVIAIQEVGGIVKHGSKYTGWRHLTKQTRSDLLAQYDVYLALTSIDPDEFEELGIIGKNISKSEEVRERLVRDLGLNDITVGPVSDDEIVPLLKSIVAGQLDQLWTVEPFGDVVHIGTGKHRELSSGTMVRGASLIAGVPFDLEVPTPKGLKTLNLVTDVTTVQADWLETLAPHLFEVKPGKIYFDHHQGTLAMRTHLKFGREMLEAAGSPILEHTPENRRLFIKLYASWAHDQLQKEQAGLQFAHTRRRVPSIPLRQVQNRVEQLSDGAISLVELDKKRRVELLKLARMGTYIGDDFMKKLSAHRDDNSRHPDKSSWQPAHKGKHFRRRDRR